MIDPDSRHVRVGRVLSEDDDQVTLEIYKDLDATIHLEDGDAFYSVVFVHVTDPGGDAESWIPWEV